MANGPLRRPDLWRDLPERRMRPLRAQHDGLWRLRRLCDLLRRVGRRAGLAHGSLRPLGLRRHLLKRLVHQLRLEWHSLRRHWNLHLRDMRRGWRVHSPRGKPVWHLHQLLLQRHDLQDIG